MTTESLRTTPEQRTYIRKLIEKRGNSITSEQLVMAAEPGDSPIHDLFTWNNRRAAHLYRLRQAARILRSYTGWLPTVVKTSPGGKDDVLVAANKIPLAVKVRTSPDEDPKWVGTANALENEYMKQQVISDRLRRIKQALQQLLVVPELEDLYQQLTTVINRYKVVIAPYGVGTEKGVAPKKGEKTPKKSERKEQDHVRA
jgi:hypothetical protein